MRRRGFTLIEACVAMSITTMAGAVLLLSTEGVLETTNDAVDQTIAQGMAVQLIDEVLGARYHNEWADPYEAELEPSGYAKSGSGREQFQATEDYNGFEAMPPEDPWGEKLGEGDGYGVKRRGAFRRPGDDFDNWRQRIEVYYVDASNPSVRLPDNTPSDYRAVEVTIERVEDNGAVRPLAKQRRVFCYVPIP